VGNKRAAPLGVIPVPPRVIPVKTGIQRVVESAAAWLLDSRFHGNDARGGGARENEYGTGIEYNVLIRMEESG